MHLATNAGFGFLDRGPRGCGIFEDLSSESARVEYAAKAYALRYGGAVAPAGLIAQVKSAGYCSKANVDGQVAAYGPPRAGDAPSVDAAEALGGGAGAAAGPQGPSQQQLVQMQAAQQEQERQKRNRIIAWVAGGVGAVALLGIVAAVALRSPPNTGGRSRS